MKKTCCSTVVQSTAHVKRQINILIVNWAYILSIYFKKAQILAFEKSLEKGKKDILRINSVFIIIIIIIIIEKGVSSYLKDTY